MRRLELWGDGLLLEARDVRMDAAAAGRRDHRRRRPAASAVVEVRLVAADGSSDPAKPPDQLAVDDRAWAIVPPDRKREILLVGEGDPYLETALSYLPNSNLFGVAPGRYPADAQRRDGTDWDLIIFEGFVPATLPTTPTLVIAPPSTSPVGDRVGQADEPGHRDALPGRADPSLRRPLDDPHRRSGQARAAGLGPIGDSGTQGRAAPVRRVPGRRPDRPSSPSSRAAPTCRSRSRSRS